MKHFLSIIPVLFASAFIFQAGIGCATIVDGKTQIVSISSNIDGADIVIIDTKKGTTIKVGTTPFTGAVPRIHHAILKVSKNGYKSTQLAMNTEVNYIFLGGIITGGTTGTTTDYSTGALWRYTPSSYMANLEPVTNAASIEKFRRESPVRIFSLMNYDRLTSDIAAGRGEYLDSLYSMYNTSNNDQKDLLLKQLKQIHKRSTSIEEFSTGLVELL